MSEKANLLHEEQNQDEEERPWVSQFALETPEKPKSEGPINSVKPEKGENTPKFDENNEKKCSEIQTQSKMSDAPLIIPRISQLGPEGVQSIEILSTNPSFLQQLAGENIAEKAKILEMKDRSPKSCQKNKKISKPYHDYSGTGKFCSEKTGKHTPKINKAENFYFSPKSKVGDEFKKSSPICADYEKFENRCSDPDLEIERQYTANFNVINNAVSEEEEKDEYVPVEDGKKINIPKVNITHQPISKRTSREKEENFIIPEKFRDDTNRNIEDRIIVSANYQRLSMSVCQSPKNKSLVLESFQSGF
jgi:hypothetical protein